MFYDIKYVLDRCIIDDVARKNTTNSNYKLREDFLSERTQLVDQIDQKGDVDCWHVIGIYHLEVK